ncbi:MAG: hypothetical protein A3F17_08435 [Gammaproteobacteria bacterium RIFCSPHIGHO2_12_FULL_41_15]|nr:MAG: hypothetical protein A3F17_08435 [Gammaproteobacteria bacterium RIFCSPHIGHO2_12_FULL_41_15]
MVVLRTAIQTIKQAIGNMKTTKTILNHYRFDKILKQTQFLEKMNSVLIPCLPNECIGHVYVASVIPPTLVLHTSDAGFATNLRFRANEILERIRFLTDYTQFTQLKIQVTPEDFSIQTIKTPPKPLGKTSIKAMNAIADSVKHADLKAALKKFGDAGGKPSAK